MSEWARLVSRAAPEDLESYSKAMREIQEQTARTLTARQRAGAERVFEGALRAGYPDLAVKVKVALDRVIDLIDPDLE